jgi:alpha-N-arabinofuranosidase
VQYYSPDYTYGSEKIPAVNVSASKDSTGAIHVSFVNLDAAKKIAVRASLPGIAFKTVQGQVLTSARFTDVNTFDAPNKVKPAVFNGARKEGNDLVVDLPAMSVVVLELK